MLPKIGPVELTLILVIVVMLFGVGRLPEVFGSIGKGMREFRRNVKEADEGNDTTTSVVETTTTTPGETSTHDATYDDTMPAPPTAAASSTTSPTTLTSPTPTITPKTPTDQV